MTFGEFQAIAYERDTEQPEDYEWPRLCKQCKEELYENDQDRTMCDLCLDGEE